MLRVGLVGACLLATSSGVQAAGRGIGQCSTINQAGSYVLTKNLTAAGDCLVVTADFVTIDLDGYTIAGNGTGKGISGDQRNVAVRNGVIVNFAFGILLDSTTGGAVIEKVRLFGNGKGIVCGNSCTITDNTLEQNGDGIEVNEAARIVGNTVGECTTNGGNGIFLGDNSYASGNTVFNNNGRGIVGVNNNLVTDNIVKGSDGVGIQVQDGNTITKNSVQFNDSGIVVGQGNSVIGNTSTGHSLGAGLIATCPSNIVENTLVGNTPNLTQIGLGCNASNNVQ
jgi:parallel beta-helix repeat protein